MINRSSANAAAQDDIEGVIYLYILAKQKFSIEAPDALIITNYSLNCRFLAFGKYYFETKLS